MFRKKKLEKRIADLEARIESLETVRTPDYGNIPTSQLWKYIDRFVKTRIKASASKT